MVLSFLPFFDFYFSSLFFVFELLMLLPGSQAPSHFRPHCCTPLQSFLQINGLFLQAKIYWAFLVTPIPGSATAHTSLPSFCAVVYAHSVIILFSEVTDLLQHPPTLLVLSALQQLYCFSVWLENTVHNLRNDENSNTATKIKKPISF